MIFEKKYEEIIVQNIFLCLSLLKQSQS